MPDDAKPLSESEIKSICAYLSDSSISLPAGDMVSTRELGLVLESAVAFEQRLFATIRELRAAQEICHGTFVDELDGKPVPGTIFDGTDAACPGWWRGHDNGAEGAMKRAEKAEAEIGRLLDSGSAEAENLKVEKKRLVDALEEALHDANNRIMIAEAKTERLTEKLEAIASVPFESFSSAIAKAAIAESEGEDG